jgi:hypothetical protein
MSVLMDDSAKTVMSTYGKAESGRVQGPEAEPRNDAAP